MPTFKHSGDLGDIIFALPTIRTLGGGTLLLDPAGGASEPAVAATTHPRKRTRLTQQRIDDLRPLLELQPYIESVDYWSASTSTTTSISSAVTSREARSRMRT